MAWIDVVDQDKAVLDYAVKLTKKPGALKKRILIN